MAAVPGSHGIAVLALIFYLISIPVSASVCISCSPRRTAGACTSKTTAAYIAAIPDRAGFYCGTSTGQNFHTRDEELEWQLLADFLPPVYSVEAFGPFDCISAAARLFRAGFDDLSTPDCEIVIGRKSFGVT
jgi:hypothetical protein